MSENNHTYLVIDAGNTRVKTALYTAEDYVSVHHFSQNDEAAFFSFLKEATYDFAILSSVLESDKTAEILALTHNCLTLDKAKIPVQNNYGSPETLGADRLANAVAAMFKARGNRLVIDVGTCIKFDFVDAADTYLGGSISPGLRMRYEAMHHFTGRLPLLEPEKPGNHLGSTTESCMHAGALQGAQEEINGFIRYYEDKYEGLTIFVTGGDYLYFDYSAKNGIFADDNLTLFGLLQILKANVQ
ncbi:MAG: putative transcriptional acitvator, Baf family [Crocinitomicaceae bacterium]|jgi:type III pantothenate kinase|nr:putative transcriptional acitvator, Baf family [Crocinitomicaceae bacterium]